MLLRKAAKARIDRMCKPHGKRTALNAPEWLKAEWAKGNKNEIADVLRECNFQKDPELSTCFFLVMITMIMMIMMMMMMMMRMFPNVLAGSYMIQMEILTMASEEFTIKNFRITSLNYYHEPQK